MIRPEEKAHHRGPAEEIPEESSRQFMKQHWQLNESCCQEGARDSFYDQLLHYYLTITCMPFQDVWSLDLERLRACCGHLVTPDRRIIPFCAYYLTSIDGQRLYHQALVETITPIIKGSSK